MKRWFFFLLILSCYSRPCVADASHLVQTGWHYLIQDNDTLAIQYFNKALNEAIDQHDEAAQANAFLYLGFASYGSSLHQGLHYAQESLQRFEHLHNNTGIGRCWQLLATIHAREGKWKQAELFAQRALQCFTAQRDTTLTKGLSLHLLGNINEQQNDLDSAAFFYQEAFRFRLAQRDSVYLGASCIQMGKLAQQKQDKPRADSFFHQALSLAQHDSNKQAMVNAWLALSEYHFNFNHLEPGYAALQEAKLLSERLADKSFLLRCITLEKNLAVRTKNYQQAVHLSEQLLQVKDSMKNYDEERLTRMLELQFDVKETERKLLLIQNQHRIARLTNYLLLGGLFVLLFIAGTGFLFYRKNHRQQQELIATQQALLESREAQQQLNEQTLRNEIEFKESQLSAITIQMLQKNQLLEEIQEKLENREGDLSVGISKVIHKNQVQEQEWDDFNKSFERVNKNFYSRIKQQYPEISQNELKICALIKMNLSMKEMAAILAISPDSVKTARYRLRKKLQLQTEDNLHAFIMTL